MPLPECFSNLRSLVEKAPYKRQDYFLLVKPRPMAFQQAHFLSRLTLLQPMSDDSDFVVRQATQMDNRAFTFTGLGTLDSKCLRKG